MDGAHLASLKTGDIILFSGTCWVGKTIKLLSWSRWSHVGMVVYGPSHSEPMVYESTHCNKLKCFDTGENTMGVQLVPLKDRVDIYKGRVAYRHLYSELSEEQLYSLKLFRHSMQGKDFERSKYQMWSSNYSFIPSKEDLSSLFCSELIAAAYQELGLLGKEIPSNKFVPKDFSAKGNIDFIGATLGPEIMLK